MKDNPAFKDFDLMMLPLATNCLVHKDEFIAADNFGCPIDKDTLDRFVNASHPFKISFIMGMYCTQGSMRIRLNLKEYLLQANDVLAVLPGYIGECLAFSEDCQIALLAYSGKNPFWNNNAANSIPVLNYITKNPLLHLQPEKAAEAMEIYRLVRKRMQDTGFRYTSEAIAGYMRVLASLFYQQASECIEQHAAQETESRHEVLFMKFMELAQEHYREERSITFYAGKMCLTPKYLSIAIRKASGRHAGEWIKDLVILEAKALLKSREYTVQQVCDLLNFANPSFFGKYFKAATGCSPRKYMLG